MPSGILATRRVKEALAIKLPYLPRGYWRGNIKAFHGRRFLTHMCFTPIALAQSHMMNANGKIEVPAHGQQGAMG